MKSPHPNVLVCPNKGLLKPYDNKKNKHPIFPKTSTVANLENTIENIKFLRYMTLENLNSSVFFTHIRLGT